MGKTTYTFEQIAVSVANDKDVNLIFVHAVTIVIITIPISIKQLYLLMRNISLEENRNKKMKI
jgi:hypothetical protein